MMLQPTCPFRTSQDINNAIQIMKKNKADSFLSLVDVEGFHPARMKFIINGKIKILVMQKMTICLDKNLKKVYLRSGLIYLLKTHLLKKNTFTKK